MIRFKRRMMFALMIAASIGVAACTAVKPPPIHLSPEALQDGYIVSGQLTPRIGQVFTDGRSTFVQFSGAPPAHLSVRGDASAGALPYTRHGDIVVVSGEPASFQLTTPGSAVSIERAAPGRGSPVAASKDDAMDTMTHAAYQVDSNADWVGVDQPAAVAPAPGAPQPPGQAVATPRASPLPR